MDKKQFMDWKDKYWNLYYVEIEEQEFLFRELSRSEYKKAVRLYQEDPSVLEEYICQTAILEPADYDFEECIAGIPTSLSNFILYESGFTEDTGKLTEYMSKYRKEMETLDNQIACIIKEAFSDLSIEEIENWPMEKTIWYYSRAEYILNDLRHIDLVISNRNEETQAPQKKQKPAIQKPQQPQEGDRKFEFDLDAGGSASDFSELSEIDAFMKGKWNPPQVSEGEELI